MENKVKIIAKIYFFKKLYFCLLIKKNESNTIVSINSKYPSPNLVIKWKNFSVLSECLKKLKSELYDKCLKKNLSIEKI